MGPWLCSHGNNTKAFAGWAEQQLQWGRGCVATEMTAAQKVWQAQHPLQWGRGCVATEITVTRQEDLTSAPASMGPWLCSHGN